MTTTHAHLPPRPTLAKSGFWRRWVVRVTGAETVGFAVPALAGVLGWAAGVPTGVLLTLGVAGGAIEGAALALGEHSVARERLPELPRGRWVGFTAAAAAAAWALGLTPSALHDLGLPVVGVVAAWLVAAPLILLSIGVAQALVLRRLLGETAWWWVALNAAAWLVGIIPTFVGPALAPNGAPAAAWVVAFVLSGLLMAATVAAATGAGFAWLLRRAGVSEA
jgi:hypothetical protein